MCAPCTVHRACTLPWGTPVRDTTNVLSYATSRTACALLLHCATTVKECVRIACVHGSGRACAAVC
eukprot:8208195-Alexandrium_andersonii.AAC.1